MAPYAYEFDETSTGNISVARKQYAVIHEGLAELCSRLKDWNSMALKQGARREPYEQEFKDLDRMIRRGNELLAKASPEIRINGISVGSKRYWRAGLELMVTRMRNELRKCRDEGWPSAALSSVEESILALEDLAEKISVPPATVLWEILTPPTANEVVGHMRELDSMTLWDVFISHASEDKEVFVLPLAHALVAHGLSVWYDDFTLQVGDSLRRSIDKGLSRSRYGVVVLSPSFFAKEWPQRELDGLVAREISGERVLLPVWHDVDAGAVRRYSPTLADRVAVTTKGGLEAVVARLVRAMTKMTSEAGP